MNMCDNKKNKEINNNDFSLDLVYAECKKCKTPLLWKKEQSLHVLKALSVPFTSISFFSIFISAGCPHCSPNETQYPIELLDTRNTQYPINSGSSLFWSNTA